MFTVIVFDPAFTGDIHDETRRYVNASHAQDPETAADPEFEGMIFEEIDDVLMEIDRENELAYDDWAHANRIYYADHRISHG